MTGDAQTRPTTEAERALVERSLRADRASATGGVLSMSAVALVLAVLGALWEEPAAIGIGLSIGGGSAVAFWILSRPVRHRQPVDIFQAKRHSGTADVRYAYGVLGGEDKLRVGVQTMTIPSHWLGYFVEGEPHTVWGIETTGDPVAVAVERGPSADADDVLGAHTLLDQRICPGRYLATALAVSSFALVCLGLVVGFDIPPLAIALAAGIAACGTYAVASDVRTRSALHRAYFDNGARFASPPGARLRFTLREVILNAAGAGAVSLLLVPAYGVSALAFAAVGAALIAVASLLRRSEPRGHSSNPGSGVLSPAAP